MKNTDDERRFCSQNDFTDVPFRTGMEKITVTLVPFAASLTVTTPRGAESVPPVPETVRMRKTPLFWAFTNPFVRSQPPATKPVNLLAVELARVMTPADGAVMLMSPPTLATVYVANVVAPRIAATMRSSKVLNDNAKVRSPPAARLLVIAD